MDLMSLCLVIAPHRAIFAFPSVLRPARSSAYRHLFVLVTETERSAVDDNESSIYAREPDALAKLRSTFLKTLRDRGFLHQCTGISQLDEKLCESTQSAYLGFDATADSLHIGSLLQIMILRHLQKSGHKPMVLVGGGTTKVGDPTRKDKLRVMLTEEAIQQNIAGISKVFKKFLVFGDTNPTDAIMVNKK